MGYLHHLECTACGAQFTPDRPHTVCERCGKVLYPRYDLDRAKAEIRRDEIAGRVPTMGRYREPMPVSDAAHIVTLGEGMTPLLPLPAAGRWDDPDTIRLAGPVRSRRSPPGSAVL